MLLHIITTLLSCSLLDFTTYGQDISDFPSISFRIVHGNRALRGQFCYQAHLKLSDGERMWACGGSLVSTSVILTAAHCVIRATKAEAVLGGLNLHEHDEPGRLTISIDSNGLRAHENYDTHTKYNDIAVLKLPNPVELSKYICTVKVPGCTSKLSADSDEENYFTVSGWGRISDETRTAHLMYFSPSREPHDACAIYHKYIEHYNITNSQLCMSSVMGSTCYGDSGGPLVQTDTVGRVVQRGIVSLGGHSCETGAPSVYTDLRYFVNWLCPLLQP